MAKNDLKVKVDVDLNEEGLKALSVAIDALKRISYPRSSFKDHPGRTWAYRDYELRQIAKHALKEMGIEFDP